MNSKDRPRFRNVCFTSYDEEHPDFNDQYMNYLVCQREKCPTTGRLHWQGYVEFKKQLRMNKACELISKGKRPHISNRQKSQEAAINYCKKIESAIPGTLYEIGLRKHQGNRSDLDAIVDLIESGMTMREILIEERGHALRNINLIIRGLETYYGELKIDKTIRDLRDLRNGNFNPS